MAAMLLLSFAAFHPSLFAEGAERTIPLAELREDLRIARSALEESHVGLHWFISKEEFEQRFQALEAGLDQPVAAREFYRRLLPLVAAVRHGHTGLSLPVDGVGHRLRHLDNARKYLPGALRVLNGRLYVVADLSEKKELGEGAEIIAIDGRPAGTLLDQMRLCVSAEGANDTFKMHQLGPGFQFHALLDLLFGSAESYAVDLVPASGGAQTRRTIAAVEPERMVSLHRERKGRELDYFPRAYHFELLGDGAALLTVNSFYEGLIMEGEPSFPDFFKATFRQIKESGVQDLIIDVRGNEGGNGDYAALLYSYLADKPFELAKPTTLASASISYLRYAPNPSGDIQAFAAEPLEFVAQAPDGSWLLKEKHDEERYRPYAPAPEAYTGRLHVLTDGGSFSATNGFLELVHRFHRREGRHVSFVGEENGGDNTFGKSSGGQVLTIVLPHSKLSLSIPLLGFSQHFATAQPKAAIPDHPIIPSIEDVLARTDRQLLFVRESIARQRAQKGCADAG